MPAKRNAWPMNWHNPYITRYEQANSLFYSVEEWNATHKAPERRKPTVTRIKTIAAATKSVTRVYGPDMAWQEKMRRPIELGRF
jgi:hypothetical protein